MTFWKRRAMFYNILSQIFIVNNFEINYRTKFIILLIFWMRKLSGEIIVL